MLNNRNTKLHGNSNEWKTTATCAIFPFCYRHFPLRKWLNKHGYTYLKVSHA